MLIERLIKLFAPVIESEGVDLVDVEYKKEGTVWIVRVLVDKEGGIKVDDCTNISRSLSMLLDVEDLVSTRFVLEVSSPGLNRPLKKLEDFKNFSGEKTKIKLFSPLKETKTLIGRIKEVTEEIISLEVDEEVIEIPFTMIAKAQLEPDIFPVKLKKK